MTDFAELITRLRALPAECEWVEFKQNQGDHEKIGQTFSALANGAALAGKEHAYMVWGIDDETHEIVGTKFDPQSKVGNQELQLWLRIMLSENADFHFERITIDGYNLVIAIIECARALPVEFKSIAYVRVSSSNQKLSSHPAMYKRLLASIRAFEFETGIAREDVSVEEMLELLDAERAVTALGHPTPSSNEALLARLQEERLVVAQDDGSFGITNLGAILFARRLSDFGSTRHRGIRVIKYQENNRYSALRKLEFDSGYAISFTDALESIHTLLPDWEVIEGAKRVTKYAYPPRALREALANALIHQDFAIDTTTLRVEIFPDRLEISNPGRLLLERNRIVDGAPRTRNPLLANFMLRMDYCESLGTGWDKIVFDAESAALPTPEVFSDDFGTTVTFLTHKEFSSLPIMERLWTCYTHCVLNYLDKRAGTSNADLRERFGVDGSAQVAVSKVIKRAVDEGLIKVQDPLAGRRNMRYVPAWA